MATFGLKVHVHKRTHTTGKNRGEKEKEISALRKLIAVFGAVRQNYAWNGKKSLPFISLHPSLTLRACTWEIEIGRLWCAKREREFSVCMCESALQFPSGWHCWWIYPFPPCELDLTRLHNICMGAAEFMYTVEAVFERCVCVFGGVDFCFWLSVLKSARWAGYIKGRARCSCVAAGSAAPL